MSSSTTAAPAVTRCSTETVTRYTSSPAPSSTSGSVSSMPTMAPDAPMSSKPASSSRSKTSTSMSVPPLTTPGASAYSEATVATASTSSSVEPAAASSQASTSRSSANSGGASSAAQPTSAVANAPQSSGQPASSSSALQLPSSTTAVSSTAPAPTGGAAQSGSAAASSPNAATNGAGQSGTSVASSTPVANSNTVQSGPATASSSTASNGSAAQSSSAVATSTNAGGQGASAPPAATANTGGAPPEQHKECFQQGDGTRICRWTENGNSNQTDVLNQNGIYDYHNQHSQNDGEAIAGKISGTNIQSAIAAIPTGPSMGPPAGGPPSNSSAVAPPNGGTVFEGKKESSSGGSQDIHQTSDENQSHQDSNSHNSMDWQTTSKGQADGSSSDVNIHVASDAKNESLVMDKGGEHDSASSSESKTVGGIDTDSFNPKNGNSTSDVDFKNESKSQTEEHKGNGVYEFHAETSSQGSLSQNFGGSDGIKDADKAFGDMVQALGGGGGNAKREVEDAPVATMAVLPLSDNIQHVEQDVEVAGLTDIPALALTAGQQVFGSLGNITMGDGLLEHAAEHSGVLGSLAMVFGLLVLLGLLGRKHAERRRRRGMMHDIVMEQPSKTERYSDHA